MRIFSGFWPESNFFAVVFVCGFVVAMSHLKAERILSDSTANVFKPYRRLVYHTVFVIVS